MSIYYTNNDNTNFNTYVNMLNNAYKDGTNNHPEHNDNPLYWDLLLKDIKQSPSNFDGKVALDFGCGKGRNVTNMLTLANFKRVDGIDISNDNINYCKETYINQSSNFYKNNGSDLSDLNSEEYDFVMSTIVFQHICVHELRFKLKEEIYRVLKPNGIFSFQMGYGNMEFTGHTNPKAYYENYYDATNSNGSNDVRISDENELIDDLKSIGFKNITFEIHPPFNDTGHPNWIYVNAIK
jgi:ubiquinone/menaquinone biosynthesis C-methylase UbiE